MPTRASPWSQFWSHSPPFTAVHPRPWHPVHAGHGRWRTVVNGGAQYSKACEGASLPWVQIPPPPPLTCDDASPPRLLRGGGHRGGLNFGPQMVSVDRAEISAAGWIGPNLRPCTAADMIWEETPADPCRGALGLLFLWPGRQASSGLPRTRLLVRGWRQRS